MDTRIMHHFIRKTILVILIALPCYVLAYEAKVVGITDGDTVKVLTADQETVKIRLAEIDTPERKQPWGNRAKQALSSLIYGRTVEVETVTTDRYGRTVAHLYLGNVHVNREMVRSGNAWVYRKYLKDRSLLDDERDAKQRKAGLWSLPETERTPPWEWRRSKRSS